MNMKNKAIELAVKGMLPDEAHPYIDRISKLLSFIGQHREKIQTADSNTVEVCLHNAHMANFATIAGCALSHLTPGEIRAEAEGMEELILTQGTDNQKLILVCLKYIIGKEKD